MGLVNPAFVMPSLVTRFHLLLFSVTLAIAGVALVHIPADFVFPAHWHGSSADWLWPRDGALAMAPALQISFMTAFFLMGRKFTANHLAKTRHILDSALTLLMAVTASCQLGLLLIGIGSDFDMFRIAGFGLALALLVLAAVLWEAERHTYGGLRMPWPIASDRAWAWIHRLSALASAIVALALGWFSWSDPGPGPLVLAMGAALAGLPLVAAIATLVLRRL